LYTFSRIADKESAAAADIAFSRYELAVQAAAAVD
jgi:hypothetical protein